VITEAGYNPCYLNEEHMPYTGLGFGKCQGRLVLVKSVVEGINVSYYSCSRHLEGGWYELKFTDAGINLDQPALNIS
jgi:hypothetical protein